MSGAHRDVPIPWLARLGCWLLGHNIEQTGYRMWHCTRCDRCAKSPVEMP